jgi:hypothetical protein
MNRGTFLAALVVIYPPELLFPELQTKIKQRIDCSPLFKEPRCIAAVWLFARARCRMKILI